MEKIWVITIDEVSDFEDFINKPIAFRNEDDARKALQEFKDFIKEDYAEEIEDGWVYDDRGDYVEVYGESYSQDRYCVRLFCIELN